MDTLYADILACKGVPESAEKSQIAIECAITSSGSSAAGNFGTCCSLNGCSTHAFGDSLHEVR